MRALSLKSSARFRLFLVHLPVSDGRFLGVLSYSPGWDNYHWPPNGLHLFCAIHTYRLIRRIRTVLLCTVSTAGLAHFVTCAFALKVAELPASLTLDDVNCSVARL